MEAIENLKGWGQRHRKALVLALVLVLVAYVVTGLWMKTEIDRENTRLARYRCTNISCYMNQEPLGDTWERGYRAEVLRRQEATALKFNLTREEALQVVPYMGDWEGGPALIDYWPEGFSPHGPPDLFNPP
jgi:hypothetical protein